MVPAHRRKQRDRNCKRVRFFEFLCHPMKSCTACTLMHVHSLACVTAETTPFVSHPSSAICFTAATAPFMSLTSIQHPLCHVHLLACVTAETAPFVSHPSSAIRVTAATEPCMSLTSIQHHLCHVHSLACVTAETAPFAHVLACAPYTGSTPCIGSISPHKQALPAPLHRPYPAHSLTNPHRLYQPLHTDLSLCTGSTSPHTGSTPRIGSSRPRTKAQSRS
eukprot:711979-Pelagomonas_calceolata.AAC.1